MGRHYLILDYGTTALKTALFDERFRMVASKTREFTYSYPGEGRIECDPEVYFGYAAETLRALIAENGCADSVACVSVTGQAETIIPVGRDGTPTRPAIVWIDTRAGAEAAALEREIGVDRLYRVAGIPSFDPILPLAKLPWLRTHEPDVYAVTDRFLLLRDYVQFRLTGAARSEASVNSCTGYFDIVRRCWDEGLLAAAGVSPERLPPCAAPDETLPMLPEVAAAIGLPAPVPVVNGILDQCASAIGAGCAAPGAICETTGTVLAIAATLERFDPPAGEPPASQVLCHGLPGRYIALPYCPTAGMALKWYRDTFLADWPDAYRALDAEIERRGDVEDGLLVLPHFCGRTAPYSRPEATAVMYGLTLGCDRVDIGRAVMEGVAFLLRENLEALARSGIESGELAALGGGAHSDVWLQMKADITGKTLHTITGEESTSLGCALAAALALGDLADEAALAPFASRAKTFVPNPARAGYYDAKYAKYLEVNRRLGF